MSIWKRWFAKRASAPVPSVTGMTCPFCGGGAIARSSPDTAHEVWESECGAIGSGSWMYPDLDEVADGLLAILGLEGSVSEPSVPRAGSGSVSLQRYDIPESLDQLLEILRAHGFEMQADTSSEPGERIHSIWVRRRVAQHADAVDGSRLPPMGSA